MLKREDYKSEKTKMSLPGIPYGHKHYDYTNNRDNNLISIATEHIINNIIKGTVCIC